QHEPERVPEKPAKQHRCRKAAYDQADRFNHHENQLHLADSLMRNIYRIAIHIATGAICKLD
ncbi:hypothetical protein, partial [Enterococcus faecalis]|uniref:hypothetical protein n=1 Tax=Enterococcus faecalis TaxID=1351 RepID=UPI003D6A6A55